MIVTFYDKNFNAIKDNASLNVGAWSITKRAVDFDDFTATTEAITADLNPTFVVLKDDRGRYQYGAFAGIPELTENNQTQIQASDLKTIFNNEIVAAFDYQPENGTYLDEYFSEVFDKFSEQCIQGGFTLEAEILSNVSSILMDGLTPNEAQATYNVWDDCMVPYLKYYDCYIESKLDIASKKIKITIGKISEEKSLRLWEYGMNKLSKQIAEINETQAAVTCDGLITYGPRYILLSNNAITTTESARDLFPIKRRVVLKETDDAGQVDTLLDEAKIEALKKLVESRYNETIEIQTNTAPGFENANFNTFVAVYINRGTLYKKLPVGEINTSNKGIRTIKIGYKPDTIAFYF